MTLYVGLDLSRKSFFCYAVRRSDEAAVHSGSYEMNSEGLWKCVSDLHEQTPADDPGNAEVLCFCFEAGTESHWVNEELLSAGYATHPFHPTDFAYLTKSKKKTDRIDAKKMAQAYAAGMLPERVELPRGRQEEVRRILAERAFWLRLRCATGARLKALARKKGISYEGIGSLRRPENREKLTELFGPTCREEVQRHLSGMRLCDQNIASCEKQYQTNMSAEEKVVAKRWDGIPGVGLIVTCMLAAFIGDGKRFRNGRAAASYFGLAPKVYQSGEVLRLGEITKRGPRYGRSLLLEAARSMAGSRAFKGTELSVWYEELVKRKGKKKALVGLARKLVMIMTAMAKQGRSFEPALLTAAAAA